MPIRSPIIIKKQVFFDAFELKRELGDIPQYMIFLKGASYTLSGAQLGDTRIYNDIDILADKKVHRYD
jgi:hypothetical protein